MGWYIQIRTGLAVALALELEQEHKTSLTSMSEDVTVSMSTGIQPLCLLQRLPTRADRRLNDMDAVIITWRGVESIFMFF
jgi:hypothetical protein